MANVNIELLNSCIKAVAATLGDNEAIVEIRQGTLIPSSNAQIPFLIDVATVANAETASNPRGLVAYVDSNPPHNVNQVNTKDKLGWVPLL
jgi:lysine/ornithine N-monooxygenase